MEDGTPGAAKAQEARRAAARERYGFQAPGSGAGAASGAGGAAAAAAGAGPVPPTEQELVSVDLVLSKGVVRVPYDEAPMRVYVLCEVWAKAVQQVREGMGQSVAGDGVGGRSRGEHGCRDRGSRPGNPQLSRPA